MLVLAVVLHGLSTFVAAQDIDTLEHEQALWELCTSLQAPEQAPVAGQWASYTAETEDGTSLVGFQTIGTSDDGLKMELVISGGIFSSEEQLVFQFDVPQYPYSPDQKSRVVMQAPGQPPFYMPEYMMAMMGTPVDGPVECLKSCMRSNYVGPEDVEGYGSTYDTHRIQPEGREDIDVWVSTDVPFGIVKARGGGSTMTLAEFGDGAESAIVGTPQEMLLPPGGGI